MIGSFFAYRALRSATIVGVDLGVGLFLALTPARAQAAADVFGQESAQEGSQEQAAPSLGELRDRVQARYQILPLRDGVVLMPKYGETDVQSIELADGSIAINGQPVTGAELGDRVGEEDASDIRQLSYLDAESRRVLFGIGPAPALAADKADTTAGADGDTLGVAEEEADEEGPEDDIDIDIDSADDVVRVGGSVHVRSGEVVDGDVVAVFGMVRVDGTVSGDVVAVGGSVDLGPSAIVEGEVTAVGGTIDRAPGARIEGSVSEVAWGPPAWKGMFGGPHWTFGPFFEGIGGLIGTVIWILVLGLLLCLALLLARRPIERMEYRVATSPWKAALVGLIAELVFLPVLIVTVIVLAISIIGIPLLLLVPFAILALMVGILFGFAAVAKHVGHAAERRFGWDHRNPYISLLVGLGLIMAVSFFGSALGVGGGPLDVFAIILTVFGFVIQYIAWTIGFGVLLLTRLGTRYRWGNGETPAVAPPPPAPAPEPWPVGGDLEGRRPSEPGPGV